jgi:hypothetical protein
LGKSLVIVEEEGVLIEGDLRGDLDDEVAAEEVLAVNFVEGEFVFVAVVD